MDTDPRLPLLWLLLEPKINLENIIFEQKIIEPPTTYGFKKVNSTRVWLRFGSTKVTVKKEVWAYTNLAFVADCGGLLGLFIGFNFMMIWDLIVIVYQTIKTSS